jgi:peptide/nickel transport system ATP-binding protein
MRGLAVDSLRVEVPTATATLRPVDDISFAIAPGEVLGLVGESGAGKSMTGAALIGLLEPPARIAGGRIALDSNRIDNLPAEALRRIRGRRIGAVFQDPQTSLHPLYRIGHQLEETIRTHVPLGRSEARRRAARLLQDVGIVDAERRLDDYPHQFSGGMRQRVVIALALAADPLLVVADEPTTALDVSIQAQILKLLRRLVVERAMSVLLITHDMGVIAEIADRVAVMYAGRIVESGPVAQVLMAPMHPYTQRLIGCVPRIGVRTERLQQIPGVMPPLERIPAGCAFRPRCSDAFTPCAEIPPLVCGQGRAVACWLHA